MNEQVELARLRAQEFLKDEDAKDPLMWKPFPKQTQALERTEYEVMFGGARGPGKTEAGIRWLLYDVQNPNLRALIIRRNSNDLSDWIDRASQVYSRLGAKIAGNPPTFTWPSGAVFRTGHLKDDQAYTKYQGHEYQRMLIEELTLIPSEDDYLKLLSSCRSTFDGLPSQIFSTTNPGSIGHAWVKERFVDAAPPGKTFVDPETGRTRVFIPATIDDNPILMDKDPGYVKFLEGYKTKNPELYKAWRHGEWDVFAGQAFGEFKRRTHVLDSSVVPKNGEHRMGIDWGYSGRPNDKGAFACVNFSTIKMEAIDENGDKIHFNRVIVYKEFYSKGKPPEWWARHIYDYSPFKNIKKGIADTAMFSPGIDGSVAIAERMMRKWKEIKGDNWVKLEKGTRNRMSRKAALHDWLSVAPDGLPYMMITQECKHLIRTIPLQVLDENNFEDIDCFVAGTKIMTIDGEKNIEDIEMGELVETPIGYRRVIKNKIAGKGETTTIKLSDGRTLTGTNDHKVMVKEKGLVELQNLKKCDVLMERNNTKLCHIKPLFTRVLNIVDTRVETITNRMEHILQKDTQHFIGRFILTTLVRFLKIIMFIIKIMIRMTTVSKTWSWFISQIMLAIILKIEPILKKNLRSGELAKLAKRHLKKTIKRCVNEYQKGGSRVQVVEKLLSQNTLIKNIATVSAKKFLELVRLRKFAKSVVKYLKQKGILKKKHKPVHINAVGNSGVKTVYNLTVEDAHLYYANNILCTNTEGEDHLYDALTYALTTVKFISVNTGGHGGVQRIRTVRRFDRKGNSIGINLDKFKVKKSRKKLTWRGL